MKFGSNGNINYFGTLNQPNKVHQELSHHLESLDNKIELKIHKTLNLDAFEEPKKQLSSVNNSFEKLSETKRHIGPTNEKAAKTTITSVNNTTDDTLAYTAIIAAVGGFLISKYIV